MSELGRICEAYLEMNERANYRPQAPSDGMGSVLLSRPELESEELLLHEAQAYAERFIKEEDTATFQIGISNYDTNRAFVYLIEAARVLCGGSRDALAEKLLLMALRELIEAQLIHGLRPTTTGR